jgi:hypothetical protein
VISSRPAILGSIVEIQWEMRESMVVGGKNGRMTADRDVGVTLAPSNQRRARIR